MLNFDIVELFGGCGLSTSDFLVFVSVGRCLRFTAVV